MRQVDNDRYLAVFPNKMILETFSGSNNIELAIHKITARVVKSNLDPRVFVMLQTGWVRLQGVPDAAKTKEVVKTIAGLAGDVVCVDELSLIKEDPVRVKINARNIAKIRGFVQIFIGKDGHEIRFTPEELVPKKTDPKDQPPKKPDDESDEEAESYKDTELELEKMRKAYEKESKSKKPSGQSDKQTKVGKQQVTGAIQDSPARDCTGAEERVKYPCPISEVKTEEEGGQTS